MGIMSTMSSAISPRIYLCYLCYLSIYSIIYTIKGVYNVLIIGGLLGNYRRGGVYGYQR